MNISRIASNVGNTVTKGAGAALDKVSSSKFIQNQLRIAKEDPAKFTASMALFSLISKDAINCVVYTAKSWNNKKLENPHFMAFLDLVQGILNVGGQWLVGKAILEKKLTPAKETKYTGTVKTDNLVKTLEKSKKQAEKIGAKEEVEKLAAKIKNLRETKEIDNVLDSTFDTKPLNKARVGKHITDSIDDMKKAGIEVDEKKIKGMADSAQKFIAKQCKDPFVKGIGLIITILGTTALVKRTLVPFIATPLASALDDKMKAKEEAKKEAEMNAVA